MRKRLQIRFILVVSLLFYFKQELTAQQQDQNRKFVDSLLTVLPLQKEDSGKALILINITRMKMGEAQNTGKWDADPLRSVIEFVAQLIERLFEEIGIEQHL